MRIRITGMILSVVVIFCQSGRGDLVGHWNLDEGAGSTTTAAAGSPAADGAFVGWSWETKDLPPVAGTTAAVRINGGGNGIVMTSLQGPAGDTPRTVCAWIKAEAVQSRNGVIASWGTNSDGQRYSVRLNTGANNGAVGALRLEVQGGYVTAATPVNDGKWHHVAVVRDVGVNCHDVTLYVDGVAETSVTGKSGTNRPINTGTGFPVSIGNSAHSRGVYGFDGVIDEVRIYDRVLSAAEILGVMQGGFATNPSPAYGAEGAPVDVVLSWAAPEDPNVPGVPLPGISGHDIYIGTDEATVLTADTSTAGVFRGTNPVDDVTYQPGVDDGMELAAGQTYYWRIDEAAAGDANTVKGEVWKFTTAPDPTVLAIVEQPQDTGVFEGESIVLSIVAANATGYQWFFNGAELAGQTGDALVIGDAVTAHEGSYRCTVSKNGESIDSDEAVVFVKRLMGHWTLDDTLATALEDGFDGFLIGEGQDPNFVDGIKGRALEFYGDGRAVEIANSAEAFNFYTRAVTASAWINTTQTGFGCYVSKQDRVAPWKGLVMSHNGQSPLFNIRQMLAVAVTGPGPVADGEWHMVTGTGDYATGVVRVYVDGTLQSEVAGLTMAAPPNDFPLVLGRETIQDDTAIYQGQLDDVQIWNYALEPIDVARMYTAITGKSACAGNPQYDYDGDCIVGLSDFAEIAAEWMECNLVPVDACGQ